MRVTLIFFVCALEIPAFAVGPPSETALHGQPQIITDRAERAAPVDDALAGLAAQPVDDIAVKDHSNQCDEPDGPPCGAGG
jgi:hypothetical protein